jgi:PEP-CTERM motif
MMNNMKRIVLAVAVLGLMVEVAEQARAGSIRTYQETAIASGSLGAVSFTEAEIQLTATADTSNVRSGNVLNTTYYYVPNIDLTIKVAGIGTATFTDPTQTLTYPFNQAGFYDVGVGFILLTYNPVLATYDLKSEIGPVLPENDRYFSDFRPSPTSMGILQFTFPIDTAPVFQSPAAVPEPSSLALAGLGAVCGIAYGLARKCRAQRKATTEA